MTDQTLDQLMKKVLLESIRTDDETAIPSDLQFVLSSAHQTQIQRMLSDPNGWAKKFGIPIWRVIVQKAAIILVVLSVM